MSYGRFSTWDTPDDGSGAGFVGQYDEEPPKQRSRFRPSSSLISSGPRSLPPIPTLAEMKSSLATAHTQYLTETLPNLVQSQANFNQNFLGTSATGAASGSAGPRWIRNSLGGYQTPGGDPTHPVMSMGGPVDPQLITKSPVTGQPYQNSSPLIPSNYKPRDITDEERQYAGWGSFSRGGPW